ncbi:sensor histidine kinase [Luteimicrobium subarcticum]|uniref:histidine kinase n=1 Tax=Luteimicrobium subarcticum TaxID=620910 RepID=A0A2M8W6T2_9MICO|nr:histidine kinase [Luteimicrobium subarcticum]PJI86602.1 histidine kinase [Luteimicrobium subarcticum]
MEGVRRYRWDAVAAALLVGLSFVPGIAHQGVDLGELHDRPLDAFGALLIVAQGAPIAAVRRRPATCLAVVGVAFSVDQLLGYPTTFAALGLLVALVGAGAMPGQRRRRVTALTALAAYVLLAAGLSAAGSPVTAGDFVVFGLLLAALFATGALTRVRADAGVERRHDAERAAVDAERRRIARELHDVVTHHVTAMVVQSEAAQYGVDDPARTRTGLETIADEGRAALADLRVLLGALDGPEPMDDPAATDLRSLVERAAAAGQPVDLVEHGDPRPLTGAPGLVVTRVVQESLTNAIKHAPRAPTRVAITYGAQEVTVEVTTEGTDGPGLGRGSGRGLIGLRERVDLVGGELTAAPHGTGFLVRARVPG